jgi:hypothetical protein
MVLAAGAGFGDFANQLLILRMIFLMSTNLLETGGYRNIQQKKSRLNDS